MKPENAKRFLPIMQAFAEGRTVQTLGHNRWFDCEPGSQINFYANPDFFRVKPEVIHPPFGNPPEGYTWHNPQGLTPQQVETGDGWRLVLDQEADSLTPHQLTPHQIFLNGQWEPMNIIFKDIFQGMPGAFRTKAPLPMTERQKFEAWSVHERNGLDITSRPDGLYVNPYTYAAWQAWKAAKASK